ncbi:RICIN domain-containing protein [Roseburia hominis]
MKKWYKSVISFVLILALTLAFSSSVSAKTEENGALVYKADNEATFDPGGATYSRIICLKNSGASNGTLLCTYDQLKNVSVDVGNGKKVSKQVYPIYRSTDNGDSWQLISNVYDKEYGLLRTSQPCLYELPQQVGDMPAGTILLAGNIFDDSPYTQSRIVIYKSLDKGNTWSFLSEVDNGGPCVYDPSTTSTTTTVWEPFLGLSKNGDLVCYYSDERQKEDGVLQAVSFKTSSDGVNWSALSNVAAIPNRSDRPGMITVTKLPNGKYMATYEMVNKPSISNNNAVVYCKFSEDGVTWDAESLGTRVALADGRGIGSSPYVKWVDAGGPNGMVIISAKWGTDSNDNISGGQNFYVNYNLGQGSWERLPMAVTYDYNDLAGGYFSGFSQSFDVSPDNTTLYQATNVENFTNKKTIDGVSYNLNDVRVGTLPLKGTIYEAEKATVTNAKSENAVDASNGQEVRYINEEDSSVNFGNINVSKAGNYQILVRYSNGETSEASHMVTVNGNEIGTVNYPVTVNWDRYLWSSFTCYLNEGINSVKFTKNVGFAELDCIQISETEEDFSIINKNSEKYLEVKSALTSAGAEIGQWGVTDHWCQKWTFEDEGDGYYRIKNQNSGLYLDIQNQSAVDGAKAIQSNFADSDSQLWSLEETGDGYFHIVNKNSGKYLEVVDNSKEDGAAVGQWGPTGYGCQEWTIVKEGIH